MALPDCFDPATIALAAVATREAIAKSHCADLPAAERAEIVERGVALIMAAGAYVTDGMLHLPREAT